MSTKMRERKSCSKFPRLEKNLSICSNVQIFTSGWDVWLSISVERRLSVKINDRAANEFRFSWWNTTSKGKFVDIAMLARLRNEVLGLTSPDTLTKLRLDRETSAKLVLELQGSLCSAHTGARSRYLSCAAENKFERSRARMKFESSALRFDPAIDRKSMQLDFKVSLIKDFHVSG